MSPVVCTGPPVYTRYPLLFRQSAHVYREYACHVQLNVPPLPACNEDTVESVRPCKRLALLSILPPPSCFRSNTAGLLSVYAGLTVRPDWRFGRVRRGLRDVELEMREREMFRWFSREENRKKFRWMQWHETVVEWKWLCMKEWMEDSFLFFIFY